jgi:ribonuclease VapC
MTEVILDTSAIIAVYKQERGADEVVRVADSARLSAATVAEVATWLAVNGASAEQAYSSMNQFRLVVEPFHHARAVAAGFLATKTRRRGLSLADRACLALAIELKLPVLTADRVWRDLDLDVEIRLIR